MGAVYRATDTRLGRVVAVKVLSGPHTERFEREARAVAALNHPHICQIFDVGPDYLVLEYVEGKPLAGPLPTPEALRLAIQIAGALETAHGKGIVHRDLKPANILVTAAGVKLLDFGLARLATPDGSDDTQTIAGTILGTAAYMSPEQAQGRPADARSDIFSFGLVLYEMLSGRQAFPSDTAVAAMAAIVRDEPAPIDAPPGVRNIVAQCLRKSPASRFQSARELRVALEQIAAKPDQKSPSIAVLPFVNMSRDAEDEYFSDGLAEEILNLLAKIPGLNVTARTSSFAFRGKEQDITKIGETLRVRTILEGSVRRAGTRIRVTAQLINATDGYHLWSERYDRELTDVFAVQDDIAAAIAAALKLKLADARTEARRHQPSLPAYEAVLKGRHQIFKSSPDAFARAKEYFEQAIALDPQYAEPHAELGYHYVLVGTQGLRPAREVMPAARHEAGKALELDPSEPRAHTALCGVAACYDYDWQQAEERFRLTLAADPVPPEARARVTLFHLLPHGRFAEAERQFQMILEQDPLNILFRSVYAWILAFAGQADRALTEVCKALEIDAGLWMTHYAACLAHILLERMEEAGESAERAVSLAPWQPMLPGILAGILARRGESQAAEDLLAQRKDTTVFGMMIYHLLRGNIDAALDSYAQAIEQREPLAVLFAAVRFLHPLREHPRWPTLARMMNLSPPA
jgi:serine/threonine-protein kinase